MAPLNLTFGIELEFICVFPPHCFDICVPNFEQLGEEHDDGVPREAGPAIYHTLLKAGIAASGYEPLDEDINVPSPAYSSWLLSGDACDLSKREESSIPTWMSMEDVEISSRKFDFYRDDWRREIKTFLNVLTDLETRTGCRFIVNESTGFHVHVGNGSEEIPLRAAKNVFQLGTAFERCTDLLHTVPRIQCPESIEAFGLFSPPSYFHRFNGKNKDGMMYDWLRSIETCQTYQELGLLFELRKPKFRGTLSDGHRSAYNFDNLYADESRHRPVETLTKTIEFRQHNGTLDFLEIVSWVMLVTQMVNYAHTASDVEMLALCAHGLDLGFDLGDFLSAIGLNAEAVSHFLHDEDMTFGTLSSGKTTSVEAMDHFIGLLAQNEDEQNERFDDEARKVAMDEKDYGFSKKVNIIDIRVEAIAQLFQQACIQAAKCNPVPSAELIASEAKAGVLQFLSATYAGLYSDEELERIGGGKPIVTIEAFSDAMRDLVLEDEEIEG